MTTVNGLVDSAKYAQSLGLHLSDVEAAFNQYHGIKTPDLANNFGRYWDQTGLPSFDVGVNSVPYDMLANIHKGERIIPEADNTELMQRLSSPQDDNSEMLSQLVSLNTRIRSLETSIIAGQSAIADNTRKTKNVLEKFDIDGLPKERK